MNNDKLSQALRTARIMHNSDQQELVCLPPADFKVIREHIEALAAPAAAPAASQPKPKGTELVASKVPLVLRLRVLADQIKRNDGLRDNAAQDHRTLIEAADELEAQSPAPAQAGAVHFDDMTPMQRRLHNAACVLDADGDEYGFVGLLREAIGALSAQAPAVQDEKPAWGYLNERGEPVKFMDIREQQRSEWLQLAGLPLLYAVDFKPQVQGGEP